MAPHARTRTEVGAREDGDVRSYYVVVPSVHSEGAEGGDVGGGGEGVAQAWSLIMT